MIFVFFLFVTFLGYLFLVWKKPKLIRDDDLYSDKKSKHNYNNLLVVWKTLYPVGATIFWAVYLILCLYVISPGEVGVIVNMLGEDKGAEIKEKTVGIHFVPPWKSVYKFPIFEQNHQWTGEDSFTFQTSEGLPVNAEIGITFHLEPSKIHELFSRYRRGMEEVTHLFIRNNLRDYINRFASKMKIEDLIGPKKEEFFQNVHSSVQQELDELGFVISHVYIIGQFNVPENVKEALNNKIAATQRAQQRENELREAEAQARKTIAETEGIAKSNIIKAQSEAQANNLLSKSITRELLEWNSINKWDGKMPYAMSGQGMPFIIPLPKTN